MTGKIYSASSLDDIAEMFKMAGAEADGRADRAKTMRDKAAHRAEARTWREAAMILRKTAIEGASA